MKSSQAKILVILTILIIVITIVISYYLVSNKSNYTENQPDRYPTEYPDSTTEEYEVNKNPEWLSLTTVRSFGWPITDKTYQIREFTQFTLGFDADKKQAAWVAYELLPAEIEGNVGNRPRFRPDPSLAASASPEDYTNSGYDRGHLAPAADFTYSRDAIEETFYMSNISPQLPDLNRGIWRQLEEQTRRWSLEKGRIWIVTGPVFSVRNKRIGKNKVAIPKGFYKVLFTPDTEPPEMLAFYLQNKYYNQELEQLATTVDDLETLTNYNFFSSLPDSLENKWEANLDKSKWFRLN